MTQFDACTCTTTVWADVLEALSLYKRESLKLLAPYFLIIKSKTETRGPIKRLYASGSMAVDIQLINIAADIVIMIIVCRKNKIK